jgi:CheY-like chemotaxis protein
MPMLKILFADDQIPSAKYWSLGEKELISAIKDEHPTWIGSDDFVKSFHPMRLAAEKLQGAGYDVTLARTFNEAITSIQKFQFDIAIVDLRWDADESLSRIESEAAGWKICDAIEKADAAAKRQTLQIVYSSRFNKEPEIAMRAADLNKLPIYKSYNAAGRESLLASVKFIDSLSKQKQPTETEQAISKLQDILFQYLETPLKQQQRFFWLILVFIILSISLLISGAVAVVFFNQQLFNTLSTVASLLFTTVLATLTALLAKKDKEIKKTITEVKQQLDNSLERAEKASKSKH